MILHPVKVFRPERIIIRQDQVLRVHGYKSLSTVRPDVAVAARDMAAVAENLLNAEVHYRQVRIAKLDDEGLALECGVTFSSEVFGRYARGCEEVVAFVLTTGERLDEVVRGHIDRFELIEALFLEASGWIAVESATRLFAAHLQRELTKQHRKITMRLAPGYIYKIGSKTISWPLEQQLEFFRIFDGASIPVKVMESCAMKPKLSRSGLYGIRPIGDNL